MNWIERKLRDRVLELLRERPFLLQFSLELPAPDYRSISRRKARIYDVDNDRVYDITEGS